MSQKVEIDQMPESQLLVNKISKTSPAVKKRKEIILIVEVVLAFICFAEIMMEIMIDNTLWLGDAQLVYYVQRSFTQKSEKTLFLIAEWVEVWSNPLVHSCIIIALYNAYSPINSSKVA